MSEIGQAPNSRGRIVALVAIALIFIAPVAWILWSLHAEALASESAKSQQEVLAGLQQRVAELAPADGGAVPAVDATSIYLPGGTPALAGAALQTLIGNIVTSTGGRVTESEVVEPDEAEDQSQISLRISFETDIRNLQRVLFALETGVPILLVKGLDVRSIGAAEVPATESPPLRVVMVVGAYLETQG